MPPVKRIQLTQSHSNDSLGAKVRRLRNSINDIRREASDLPDVNGRILNSNLHLIKEGHSRLRKNLLPKLKKRRKEVKNAKSVHNRMEAARIQNAKTRFGVIKVNQNSNIWKDLRAAQETAKAQNATIKSRRTWYMCKGGEGHHGGICPLGPFAPTHDRNDVVKHVQRHIKLVDPRSAEVARYGSLAI